MALAISVAALACSLVTAYQAYLMVKHAKEQDAIGKRQIDERLAQLRGLG